MLKSFNPAGDKLALRVALLTLTHVIDRHHIPMRDHHELREVDEARVQLAVVSDALVHHELPLMGLNYLRRGKTNSVAPEMAHLSHDKPVFQIIKGLAFLDRA